MTKSIRWRTALTATGVAAFVSVAATLSAASGPERSLAGIPIFAPGSQVTRKFGNPSRILVGGVSTASAGTGASAGSSGGGGYPGGGGGGYPGGGGGGYPGGGGGGYPGGGGGGSVRSSSGRPSADGGAGAGLLPGFGGIPTGGGYPGGGGGYPGGGGGYPGGGGGAADATGAAMSGKQVVTLVYDRALGGNLEFTISPDKRVVQIRETGYSGAFGTLRGIKLGMTYSQVVARYGFPENHSVAGSILNTDYKDTLHCGFQFLDQKLVGIIVAAPD